MSWQRMAAVVYGCTLLAIRLLFAALGAYVRRAHLRSPGVEDPDLEEARRKLRFAVVAYLVTILLSFLVPIVAIMLYFAIAVVMIVPFRIVAREISRGASPISRAGVSPLCCAAWWHPVPAFRATSDGVGPRTYWDTL